MLMHALLVASLLTITGILFPVLSFISGADKGLLEHHAIATWETYPIQSVLNERLKYAYLPTDHEPQIPIIIPDWYSLHYLNICSGTFIRSGNPKNPTVHTVFKNDTSTFCTGRWLDESANLTAILLYAATKGLKDREKFPLEIWNETMLEEMIDDMSSILVLDRYYSGSQLYKAVGTLFTGFGFTCFSVPLTFFATFVAITERSICRTLPHFAAASAAMSALFLTVSALLESTFIDSSSEGPLKINVTTSVTFQGLQWAGALGMVIVVFLLWYGGIRSQKDIVVKGRFKDTPKDK